jgi:hypothetical protein
VLLDPLARADEWTWEDDEALDEDGWDEWELFVGPVEEGCVSPVEEGCVSPVEEGCVSPEDALGEVEP